MVLQELTLALETKTLTPIKNNGTVNHNPSYPFRYLLYSSLLYGPAQPCLSLFPCFEL